MEGYAQQVHRCFGCGYCKFTTNYSDYNCPSYARFRLETYSTGGRLWLLNGCLNHELDWSPRLAEILYSCTTCRNCVEQCPMGFASDIVSWIVSARGDAVEKAGKIPPAVGRFLEATRMYRNPWKFPATDRDAWATGVKRYEPGDEYLLYVGCLGSYDEVAQQMARSVAGLLARAEVSFGILGRNEGCCGNEVHNMGEMGLFQALAEKNVKQFQELGVKKVVTLSPHAFNIFKQDYRQYGANFEVFHYTQLAQELLKRGRITPTPNRVTVTYQDPCYLGRYNKIYEEPRRILKATPGVHLVEMSRVKKDSFCCGGGSGNFFTDLLTGENSPGRIRVREARETGAEVLAVACPACMVMLTDAVKAEGLEGKLAVRDVSQIVQGGP